MRMLTSVVLATAVLISLPSRPIQADRGGEVTAPRTAISLKDQLETGLKARRPEEFAFIDRVVSMVEDGKLPLALVRGTFAWARHKRPYPFPYFERALKTRAARIGIEVK